MPEETTDANLESEESSTPLETESTEKPSEDTQSSPNDSEGKSDKLEPFHKNPRFKELIDKTNRQGQELDDLRKVLAERESPKTDPLESVIQKFKSRGMDEDVAKLVAEGIKEVVDHKVEERVQPVEAASVQREINGWIDNFKKAHTDFSEFEPEMLDVLNSLSPQEKYIVAMSPKGTELLYGYVKSKRIDKLVDAGYNRGVKDAYDNKVKKGALSPTSSGARAKSGYGSLEELEEAVSKMSTEEYKKNRTEILAEQHRLISK
jgi:phosphoglycolate phosphatase-like HAD superfamily hydrolase